jgi:hypothetical protein
MNTASHHSKMVLWVLALAAGLVLAAAGTAWAKPITYTEAQRFTEGPYTDGSTLCQTELYSTTFSYHAVEHYTYFPNTGVVHFHEWAHAKVVAVPLDGTGPTYTGTTKYGHSDTFINVERRGELIRHTYIGTVVLKGSDGSKAFLKEHEHFTFNANGVKTVDIDTGRLVCSG